MWSNEEITQPIVYWHDLYKANISRKDNNSLNKFKDIASFISFRAVDCK